MDLTAAAGICPGPGQTAGKADDVVVQRPATEIEVKRRVSSVATSGPRYGGAGTRARARLRLPAFSAP